MKKTDGWWDSLLVQFMLHMLSHVSYGTNAIHDDTNYGSPLAMNYAIQ